MQQDHASLAEPIPSIVQLTHVVAVRVPITPGHPSPRCTPGPQDPRTHPRTPARLTLYQDSRTHPRTHPKSPPRCNCESHGAATPTIQKILSSQGLPDEDAADEGAAEICALKPLLLNSSQKNKSSVWQSSTRACAVPEPSWTPGPWGAFRRKLFFLSPMMMWMTFQYVSSAGCSVAAANCCRFSELNS